MIDEAKRELTLSDERIEKAITQNGARLIILDPIQAYMGEKTDDMNRANEVRPMFRRLADVAERTGCAVILIGHLNKAAGGQERIPGLRVYLRIQKMLNNSPKRCSSCKAQERRNSCA